MRGMAIGSQTNPNMSYSGFEDNLALWSIEKVSEHERPSCIPYKAILRIREICHLPKPHSIGSVNSSPVDGTKGPDSLLNDSIDSKAVNSVTDADGVTVVRRRGGRYGRKRAKREPPAMLSGSGGL